VELQRKGRGLEGEVLGREFRGHFGLSRSATATEVVQAVYQCWQTRNIILIFHSVDWIGEENLKHLIEEFWQPLTEKLKEAIDPTKKFSSKLFMFLIDYQGEMGKSQSIFRDKIDESKIEKSPLKAPEIEVFTPDELESWLYDESESIPARFAKDIDKQVEEIIQNSEGGIPELTLEQICRNFDYNWFEESEKWLKY
jgi:hypothetical protein